MVNKIKKLVVGLSVFGLLVAPILGQAALVSAQPDPQEGLCGGSTLQFTTAECTDMSTEAVSQVDQIITTVVNVLSVIIGVIAVIMIIVGGLKYITSSGDSGNVTAAKNTILYAIIGLIIVALAQLIVRFVLGKVTETGTA